MKLIALNGYRCPIDGDFDASLIASGVVKCPYVANWRGTQDEIDMVMSLSDWPYVLAGFSDGCLTAYRTAATDSRVVHLVIHSGLWSNRTLGGRSVRGSGVRLHFYRTAGDRTPTYKQTYEASRYFSINGFRCLGPQDFQPTETHWLLRLLRHEFQNCVPTLLDLVGVVGASTKCSKLGFAEALRIFTSRIVGVSKR